MQDTIKTPMRGRGALENPKNRFEALDVVIEPDAELPERIATQVYKDASRSIIASNDSPDVGFSASLNAYRGCEHGCIYCFARPTHEYLGLSAGLDFETKLFAKLDAPALLRAELSKKSWVPQPIGMSGVTDCYQPVERTLKITRGCLAVLAEFRNPVVVITKNHLVTRDIDLLRELASHNAVRVCISVTTLDAELARKLEPRASAPQRRLQAIGELSAAGIPVSVLMAPIIPGLTDHEIPQLLERAAASGAGRASYTMLRLPYGVKDLFHSWMTEHYPLKAAKVENRLRDIRGGKLNDPNFGSRMTGGGIFAEQIASLFENACKRYGLNKPRAPLSSAAFRRVSDQLNLL